MDEILHVQWNVYLRLLPPLVIFQFWKTDINTLPYFRCMMFQIMIFVFIRISNTKHILSWCQSPRIKTYQHVHMIKRKEVKKKKLGDFVVLLYKKQELVRNLYLSSTNCYLLERRYFYFSITDFCLCVLFNSAIFCVHWSVPEMLRTLRQ